MIDALVEQFSNEDLLRMDGFDDCLAGVVMRYGQSPILCYDHGKVIAKLESDGMTREEAFDFFEFNQFGAWVGPLTPCFLWRPECED